MATYPLAADVRPAKITRIPPKTGISANRRDLIGGATAAVVAVLASAPSMASSLPEIERHWQERARAYREFEADPLVLQDDARAIRYWNRIDPAEVAILASEDSSPRAVEIRLWTAWSHTEREMGHAITQGDVATLRTRFDDFDWHEKMLFTAILALRGEKL